MSKIIFMHDDSEFAHWWKILGTEAIAGVMAPIKQPLRFFMPAYQDRVDKFGWIHPREVGPETMLSGQEYHDLMLNTRIVFKHSVDAYDGKLTREYIDEYAMWERPITKRALEYIKPVGMPKECFITEAEVKVRNWINKLLHTENTFDKDFVAFAQWLKQRKSFKAMDRYDLGRRGFYYASRRYGRVFAGQHFTTY